MAIQFSARTDIGLTRDQNEDNFLIDRKLQLFIVCDGMGGHNSGEVASATAVNVVREILLKQRQVLEDYRSGSTKVTERDIRDLLAEAVETANSRIHERGIASVAQRGMGTTLCMLLIAGSRGFYAHVGDSRLYRQRGESYEQLTMDHSFYNEVMLNQPELASELIDDRFKNAITRALGPTVSVEVDTEDFQLKPGDKFMLCSDGLHGYLDEDEGALERLMGMSDLDRSAEAMIRYANDQGGKDNTTAIIVQVGEEVAVRAETPSVYGVLRGFPLLRHLNDAELKHLVSLSSEREFAAGAQVWADNDETDGLYIIISGHLQISRSNTLISRIGPGQYVGSITVMDGGRRSAAAHADKRGPAKVLIIARDAFNDILLKQQGLGVKLLWGIARSLAARLRNATDQLVSAAPQTPEFLRGDVEFKGGPQPEWTEQDSDRSGRREMAETLPEIPPQLLRPDEASGPESSDLDRKAVVKKKKKKKKTKTSMSVGTVPGEEVKKKKKKKKKKPNLRAETPQFVDPSLIPARPTKTRGTDAPSGPGDGGKAEARPEKTPVHKAAVQEASAEKRPPAEATHRQAAEKSPRPGPPPAHDTSPRVPSKAGSPAPPTPTSPPALSARTERVRTPIHPEPPVIADGVGPTNRVARRIGLATPSAANKSVPPPPKPQTEADELAATASTLPKIAATQAPQSLIDDLRALKSGATPTAGGPPPGPGTQAPLAPSEDVASGDRVDVSGGDGVDGGNDVGNDQATPQVDGGVPTIGDIFGAGSSPQRSTRRRHTRRGLRTRRGSVKGKPD